MDSYQLQEPNTAPWWTLLVILARAVLAVEIEGVGRGRRPKQVIKFGLQRLLNMNKKQRRSKNKSRESFAS